MKYANPIYDVAFKYLMDDLDIARQLISTILGRPILVEGFAATELVIANKDMPSGFNAQRLDFTAVVQEADGSLRQVLIELQKSRNAVDIDRFRRYLGEAYRHATVYHDQAKSLDIITIYLLGFKLNSIPYAAVRTASILIDLHSQQPIQATTYDEEFIRQLTHEMNIIQIPRLDTHTQGQLDEVLAVFNQAYQHTDDGDLVLSMPNTAITPVNQPLVERLNLAMIDESVRRQMIEQQSFDAVMARQKTLERQKGLEEGLQLGMEKGMEKGIEQGALQKTIALARKMAQRGDSIADIMELTELSEAELKANGVY
jgi:predicted transposase/invertase (TIGR01784 family)